MVGNGVLVNVAVGGGLVGGTLVGIGVLVNVAVGGGLVGVGV